MKIYNSIKEFLPVKIPVVTNGMFDGVHIGHQIILKKIKTIADKFGGETVLITYWPHPKHILEPNNKLKLLNDFEEKADFLSQYGIDHLIKINFNKNFSKITSNDFIENILINQIKTKILVVGYNHKFGKNREGNIDDLYHYKDFEVIEIPKADIENIDISSTKIRTYLNDGDVEKANLLLNRNYEIIGKVVRGDGLGKTIGFPTANIKVNFPSKLIPAVGVYAVIVEVDFIKYKGMLYIGFRPTLKNKSMTIEAHIFELNKNLYGKTLKLYFIKHIRSEKHFSGIDSLANQLKKDMEYVKKIIHL